MTCKVIQLILQNQEKEDKEKLEYKQQLTDLYNKLVADIGCMPNVEYYYTKKILWLFPVMEIKTMEIKINLNENNITIDYGDYNTKVFIYRDYNLDPLGSFCSSNEDGYCPGQSYDKLIIKISNSISKEIKDKKCRILSSPSEKK